MKKGIASFILIIIIIVLVAGGIGTYFLVSKPGEITQITTQPSSRLIPGSPEAVVTYVLDNLMKGNYDAAFAHFVDISGNSIPQEIKQPIINSFQNNSLSRYQLSRTMTANQLLEEYGEERTSDRETLLALLKIFEDVNVVFVITTYKDTQGIGAFLLVKHQGSWKILPPEYY